LSSFNLFKNNQNFGNAIRGSPCQNSFEKNKKQT